MSNNRLFSAKKLYFYLFSSAEDAKNAHYSVTGTLTSGLSTLLALKISKNMEVILLEPGGSMLLLEIYKENQKDEWSYWKVLRGEKIYWIVVLDDVLNDGELESVGKGDKCQL